MEKKPEIYDFGGWATRFNIKCSDNRVIKPEAFDLAHGQRVPLVWNHNHKDADNVLGHAILEKREEGIYAYGLFNETEEGKRAKELVKHKDITALSIYANKLKQKGTDVIHGIIREVSLVLAGANMGAFIDTILVHGEGDNSEEDAEIYNSSEDIVITHHEEEVTPEQIDSNIPKTEEKEVAKEKEVLNPDLKHEEAGSEETVQDVVDSMSETQRNVMYALIGQALEDAQKNQEGDEAMKQNAFDKTQENEENVLTHAEMQEIIADAKRSGSMKEAFIAHGITNVDVLFPEVQSVNKTPELIQRDMDWVQKVMKSVRHTPFSRIKSTAANTTAEEARAKGYVKGNQKVEEVITALKRTTTPTTVYKFQKMDRDDVIDITDFDVVAFLKAEMRVMLDEEIARAVLIGDGRASDSDDKINPLNVRPILGDSSTYAVPKILTRADNITDYAFAKQFIKEVLKARKEYKGSGNPTLFTTEDLLTDMLLIEDTNGRVIYDTIDKLTTALRVSSIVTVPVFENVSRTDLAEEFDFSLLGVVVNLTDYNIGADKGGAINMFDDFDLNFNKYEYLIETRISGALIKPFSALTFELKTAHVAG